MNSTPKVIQELESLGVAVWLEGGRIKYHASSGAISPELFERLKEAREEIRHYLSTPADRGEVDGRLVPSCDSLAEKLPASVGPADPTRSPSLASPVERSKGDEACFACGGVDRWSLGPRLPWVCSTCHPPPIDSPVLALLKKLLCSCTSFDWEEYARRMRMRELQLGQPKEEAEFDALVDIMRSVVIGSGTGITNLRSSTGVDHTEAVVS